MTNLKKYFRLMAIAVMILSMYSCEEDDKGDETEDLLFNVQVMSSTAFGKVLVNQNEQAIYFFASDMGSESNCTSGCEAKWPPVLAAVTDLDLGSDLNIDHFGTVSRADGQKQLTYKGWPLYYFSPAGDGVLETVGEITGDGLGNSFYVAKPDYSVMIGKKSVVEGEDAVFYLVDSWGVTLYDFTNDTENVSNCTGGCASAWPVLNSPETLMIPSKLTSTKFSTVVRQDDLGDQLGYNGLALYYFTTDDDIRGNVLGHGASDKFFVVELSF